MPKENAVKKMNQLNQGYGQFTITPKKLSDSDTDNIVLQEISSPTVNNTTGLGLDQDPHFG